MQTPLGEIPDRIARGLTMAERSDWLRARVSRRSFLKGAVAAGGAALVGPTIWSRPGFASVPNEAPRVVFGGDPRSQMTVSWMTAESVLHPAVELPDGGTLLGPVESRGVAGTSTVYHHARIGGLAAGARYGYVVKHDGAVGDALSFRTAPSSPVPFRFTAFGDQGTSASARGMTALVQTQAPDLHFHVGDLCYANRIGGADRALGIDAVLPDTPDQAAWDTWFRMIAPVASATPWMTTVGNHEMETGWGSLGYDGYFSRFALPETGPSGHPVIYAFRYANVGFVSLDANDASYEIDPNRGYTGGAQGQWLAQTLAALRADPDVDFIVAGFHHCAYCTNAVHGSDAGVRERFGALLDAYHVDLVINGHNHNYERTHPVREGDPTREAPPGAVVESADDGTTYVTAGGGGQVSYQASLHPASYVTVEGGLRLPETAEWSAVRYLDLSLVVADVIPPVDGVATLHLRALDATGGLRDEITLKRTRPS